jgi:hypothetical protein
METFEPISVTSVSPVSKLRDLRLLPLSSNSCHFRSVADVQKLHRALGPGLLESAYCACLCYELVRAGLSIETQKPLPLVYDRVKIDCAYRPDILANY